MGEVVRLDDYRQPAAPKRRPMTPQEQMAVACAVVILGTVFVAVAMVVWVNSELAQRVAMEKLKP